MLSLNTNKCSYQNQHDSILFDKVLVMSDTNWSLLFKQMSFEWWSQLKFMGRFPIFGTNNCKDKQSRISMGTVFNTWTGFLRLLFKLRYFHTIRITACFLLYGFSETKKLQVSRNNSNLWLSLCWSVFCLVTLLKPVYPVLDQIVIHFIKHKLVRTFKLHKNDISTALKSFSLHEFAINR
jgi:hypothetical protein